MVNELTYRGACAGTALGEDFSHQMNPPVITRQMEINCVPVMIPPNTEPRPGIVAKEFQKITRHAIEDEKGGQYLSIELFALEQPHQDKEICQFDCRLEQLCGLKRHSSAEFKNSIGDGIGESHAPEMGCRLAIATAGGKASDPADSVAHCQPGGECVPGSQRRHIVFADVPDRRHRGAKQPAGKDSAGLQRAEAENFARMGRSSSPSR